MPTNKGGFGLDFEAMSIRFAEECIARGVVSRADLIAKWNAATEAQRLRFIARIVFGSAVFPGDQQNLNPYQVAAGQTVPP